MTPSDHQPTCIEIREGGLLAVRWSDGAFGTCPLTEVRRNCPCASCKQAREAPQTGLPIAETADVQRDQAAVASIQLVGRYAIRIIWKDGHSAGIYDYSRLRALCDANTPPNRSSTKSV